MYDFLQVCIGNLQCSVLVDLWPCTEWSPVMFANSFYGAYADVSCIKCICMMWYFERTMVTFGKPLLHWMQMWYFGTECIYAMICFLMLFNCLTYYFYDQKLSKMVMLSRIKTTNSKMFVLCYFIFGNRILKRIYSVWKFKILEIYVTSSRNKKLNSMLKVAVNVKGNHRWVIFSTAVFLCSTVCTM
jgi:hypothetical protein